MATTESTPKKTSVRIFKLHNRRGYYDSSIDLQHAVDAWTEVDDNELREIKIAITHANKHVAQNAEFQYVLVEKSESLLDEMFADARAFAQKMMAEKRKAEEAKHKADEQKAAKALVAKQKRLEKLQKELSALHEKA